MIDVIDRQIVVPGQYLGSEIRCDGLCSKKQDGIYSSVKALVRCQENSVNLIPLNGAYVPKAGDIVVGVVEHDFGGVYAVDIAGPYRCILRPRSNSRGPSGNNRAPSGGGGGRGKYQGNSRDQRDEPDSFKVGQIISAKVGSVDEQKEAQLIGPRILEPALVIKVRPARIPRIIGKKKSMIEQVRNLTGSRISVGQNGLIWIKGGNAELAKQALEKIEAEAYTSGLTSRMEEYLKSRSSK